MAKKCLGVREDTGDPCKRSAGKGSDFCFAHRSQEGDERIPYLQHDVVHCPEDGQKLSYIPMDNQFVCGMCGGVLQNAKDINPMTLESILELPEVADEGLEIINKVLEMDKTKALYWETKGQILQKLGRDDEAKECFARENEIKTKDIHI